MTAVSMRFWRASEEFEQLADLDENNSIIRSRILRVIEIPSSYM